MIEVLAITSATQSCGIREYGNYVGRHLPGDLHMVHGEGWLDPAVFFRDLPRLREYQGPQVAWINYHAALHSRWTPQQIDILRLQGLPVVVTYHDTGVPNSEQCLGVYRAVQDSGRPRAAAKMIVHEPCADLPGATYLRQGIPAGQHPYIFNRDVGDPPTAAQIQVGPGWSHAITWHLGRNNRPILGTVGFPFPWKNDELLASATARAGWSLLLLAPGATEAQIAAWRALNPWTAVIPRFIPAEPVVAYLAGCDATAFLYMCANTGTSGAIRQGIAARKPVLATAGCRQFRDLELDHLGQQAITWLHDLSPEGVADALMRVPIARLSPGVQRLAERDSWSTVGEHYARIFRSVCGLDATGPNHHIPTGVSKVDAE